MASNAFIREAKQICEVANLEAISCSKDYRVATLSSSKIIGRKNGTCGELSKSIQIFFCVFDIK